MQRVPELGGGQGKTNHRGGYAAGSTVQKGIPSAAAATTAATASVENLNFARQSTQRNRQCFHTARLLQQANDPLLRVELILFFARQDGFVQTIDDHARMKLKWNG